MISHHQDITDSTTITRHVSELRATFRSGVTRDLTTRRRLLLQLQTLLQDGFDDLRHALWLDLHKHSLEVRTSELSTVEHELQLHLDYLEDWAKPERVSTNLLNLPGSSYIHRMPLGVVCVIGAWNYPVQLLLMPLVGCLSAGNCALLRLPGNDTSMHTNEVLTKLIAKHMDDRFVRVVNGGVDETKVMLQHKFDLIFCTGGAFIGKVVAKAAAETLTPTILELGGKSPAIVDANCDLSVCARRLAWGAFTNAGQTCVRPDYVLVDKRIGDQFVGLVESSVKQFFGDDPEKSDSFGRIINDRSFQRVAGLLDQDKSFVTLGANSNSSARYIAPTVLNFRDKFQAFSTSAVMSQEIFGPVLPVCYYDTLDQAINFINDHEKPLALHICSKDTAVQDRILDETTSGGAVVNDCLVQMGNPSLPFGGVGASGHGAYHGKYSFEAFSHRKSVMKKSTMMDAPERYAPYSAANEDKLKFLLRPVSRKFATSLRFGAAAAAVAIAGVTIKAAMN
ncbi:TPA: hypothetical protein N0F65_006708 [Lagenidium giganteum]|uniref:Aldehyde dehydrogenase n=1 Tax=Lagenidium giganteum TaxID=4803 RepID=A0AAV2Z864_9STRA|nr:TPA: hypothetical protein N0F65_006708 [Lagenidium giganteum]